MTDTTKSIWEQREGESREQAAARITAYNEAKRAQECSEPEVVTSATAEPTSTDFATLTFSNGTFGTQIKLSALGLLNLFESLQADEGFIRMYAERAQIAIDEALEA
jgi:hypothetical protein